MGMKKGIASNSGKENYAVLDMNKEYELRFWAKKEGADDNSVILNSSPCRVINPGHDIECAWFLLEEAIRRNDDGTFTQML